MFTVQVAGRTYPLELTVQAFAGISELCPEQDFSRFNELLSASGTKGCLNIAALTCVLVEASETKAAYEQPGYKPHPVSIQDIMHLPFQEYLALRGVVIDTIYTGLMAKTVELADSKKATAENESR